jgi:hypothetical protein
MPIKDQEQFEAQFPDRFEDAGAWLALADAALALPPNIQAAEFQAIVDAHETARLAARYLSLAGIEAAKARQGELARAVRQVRDAWSSYRYGAAWAVLQEAQKAPDKRLTARKWLEAHNLIPTASEAAAMQRRFISARTRTPTGQRVR